MKHSGGLKKFVRENKFPIFVAAAWLLLTWGLVFVASLWHKEAFSLAAWAGSWDGGWYKSIVEGGYYNGVINQQANVAFFPLLPAIAWLVSKVTLLPTVWAGMLVSTVGFAAALVVLWHFARTFFAQSIAKMALLLVAFNPFSLYFGMFYTESLFLLLAVSAFWFIYKKQWWTAAVLAGFATATRSVGVAVAVAVMVGWVAERFAKSKSKKTWNPKPYAGSASLKVGERQRARTPWSLWLPQTLILGIIAFSGIIAFTIFMWLHTGDPFAYRTAQQFWPGRGGLNNVGNELVYLWEHRVINLEYAITAMWYACAVLAFVGFIFVLRMHQWLLALYSGITLSLPILFGTAAAMNRYALVAFPIFIAAASLVHRWPAWLRAALIAAGIAGLAVVTTLIIDPRGIFIG